MAQTVGQAALAEARKHIGEHETPAGSNRNRFGAWYGENGVPWCNIFTSFCFKVGAGVTLCEGFRAPGVGANGCAYVPSTEAWLKATGQWKGRLRQPQPGDLAVYNWDGGEPDHIGIVSECLGGGRFTAIEGNTAVGNDSNGGAVMLRERHVSQVDGFGRIKGKPHGAAAEKNRKRLATLRAWILKRVAPRKRGGFGWSWARVKKSANWREYLRRGGR